jgi:serine/threonine protein kinase
MKRYLIPCIVFLSVHALANPNKNVGPDSTPSPPKGDKAKGAVAKLMSALKLSPKKSSGLIPTCDMSLYSKGSEISNGIDGRVYVHKALNPKAGDPKYTIYKEQADNPPKWTDIEIEKNIIAKLTGTGVTADILCQGEDGKGFMMQRLNGFSLMELPNQRVRFGALHQFNVMAFGMLKTLSKLHKHKVVHLDLHLNNWLVEDFGGVIHLIDFSRARELPAKMEKQLPVLTRAPETQKTGTGFSVKTDIWILGHVWRDLLNMLLRQDFAPGEKGPQVSKTLQTILNSMINVDPEKRPTLQDIKKSYFLDELKFKEEKK